MMNNTNFELPEELLQKISGGATISQDDIIRIFGKSGQDLLNNELKPLLEAVLLSGTDEEKNAAETLRSVLTSGEYDSDKIFNYLGQIAILQRFAQKNNISGLDTIIKKAMNAILG